MARPTRFTPQTIARLIKSLRVGATHKIAAAAAGVDVSTFYRWMREGALAETDPNFDPRKRQFYHAIKEAEAHCAESMLAVVVKAAHGGTWSAAAWMLERGFGYVKTNNVKLEQTEGDRDLTPEEIVSVLGERQDGDPPDDYGI